MIIENNACYRNAQEKNLHRERNRINIIETFTHNNKEYQILHDQKEEMLFVKKSNKTIVEFDGYNRIILNNEKIGLITHSTEASKTYLIQLDGQEDIDTNLYVRNKNLIDALVFTVKHLIDNKQLKG